MAALLTAIATGSEGFADPFWIGFLSAWFSVVVVVLSALSLSR